MAKYIDGFVLTIPKDKVKQYQKMAKEGRDMWMKHGALQYFECMGDDLKPQEMGDTKTLSFPKMAKAKPDETVWFSFIIFKSKKHRNEVNTKVMDEMNKKYQDSDMKDMSMPFDMKNMAYGGFTAKIEG